MSKVTNDHGRGRQISRKRTAVKAERRDKTAPRLNYEALVDVGGDSGGFEAESVDVSLDGIRLRTAYMPELGERLVFRFDGFGGEVVAEGEVAWCEAARRGGEFGVRFTSLEPRAARLLYAMCEKEPAEKAAVSEAPPPAGAQPGDRVRLHIKGLGSPMRARVRDVARGEVLVGSSLEFLKVGRDLELEAVAGGSSRVAHIEHVGVEIDPETNVPQLVVALSYDRPSAEPGGPDDQLATAPYRVGASAPHHDALKVRERSAQPLRDDDTPGPQIIETAEARVETQRGAKLPRARHAEPPASVPASAAASVPAQQLSTFDEDCETSQHTMPTSLSPGAQAVETDGYDDDDQSPEAPRAVARMAALAGKLKPR
ncbi:MAG TPA: PilZ domain-containing protein, partial [Sorangium sp.]|nr:PilZ domain-containing protein [Sorangium sp.]